MESFVRIATLMFLFICRSSTTNVVTAFSNGAGNCTGGQAAVGGMHLENNPSPQMTFEEAGLGFFINDELIDPSDNSTTHQIRVEGLYEFAVKLVDNDNDSFEPFKGALIRVSQGDETSIANFISESSDSSTQFNSKISDQCDGQTALGVTHFDDSFKQTLGGQFDTSSYKDILIDVTVVFANNETAGSKFAYQNYVIGVAPMETEYPQQPIANNSQCWFCGQEGMRVGNATGVFDLQGTLYNCQDMEKQAMAELSTSNICQNLQSSLADDPSQTCDCTKLTNETWAPTLYNNATLAPSVAMTTLQPTTIPQTLQPSPPPSTIDALTVSPASSTNAPTDVSSAPIALPMAFLWSASCWIMFIIMREVL